MSRINIRGRGLTCILLGMLALFPLPAVSQDVMPGFDLFMTDAGSTYRDFGSTPLPADFFGPGSDPFDGIIALQGEPFGTSPFCPLDDLLGVDTIVERPIPASLPTIPSSDLIPIEMVELSLVSIDPIEVTYWWGGSELWDLEVTLSATLPSTGTMALTKTHVNGGVFTSELLVYPRLTFTKVGGGGVNVWDLGDDGTPDFYLATDVPWEYSTPTPSSCTSNFCVNPGGLTVFQAPTAQHGLQTVCPLDSPRDVLPGYDLFFTDAPTTVRDFATDPLPADFFGPGSDPFEGTVAFAGQPLGTSPYCPWDDLDLADTIVERRSPAVLPAVPSSDVIDIEIVELSLVSTEPIAVWWEGGIWQDFWDVEMTVSPLVPSLGAAQIQRLAEDGGAVFATVDLVPLFIFRQVSGPEVRILDYGDLPSWEPISAGPVPWTYHVPPLVSCTSNICINPGGLTVFAGPHMTIGLYSICQSAVGVEERTQD